VDRHLLLRGVALVVVKRGDVGVEVLGHPLLHHRVGTEVETDLAFGELRDAHARRLTNTRGDDRLVVGGVAQLRYSRTHLGTQHPHLDGVAPFTFRNVDPRHAANPRPTATRQPPRLTWKRRRLACSPGGSSNTMPLPPS